MKKTAASGMRLTPRKLIAIGIAVALVGAGVLAFGPVVRARIAAEAKGRHLEVDVGGVRPGWFAVRLLNVRVRPIGVERVDASFSEIRIELAGNLAVREVGVRGGELRLDGSPEDLSQAIQLWRSRFQLGTESGRPLFIHGEGLSVRWDPGSGGSLRGFVASKVGFSRDEHGVHVGAESARARFFDGSLTVADAAIDLEHASLKSAKAATASIEWSLSPGLSDPAPPATESTTTADSSSKPLPKSSTPKLAAAAPTAALPAPNTPLLPMPDLHALRARVELVANLLAQRVTEGVDISIDALSAKIFRDATAVTAGPGPFYLAHHPGGFEVRFSTNAGATGAPLAMRADLPIDGGDVNATLEGGPVSLALLGVKEGMGGIADVDRASIAGKGRVVLAANGDSITFDGEMSLRGFGFDQPRIAHDVVRGLDLGVSARGMMDDKGQLRLDDFAATMGALHIAASGTLDQSPDYVAATFHVDVPSASCQTLFESVPTALLPALAGSKFSGTFGARGRVAFDSRKLDDMLIDYDIQDECRVTDVPPALAREHFSRPFEHQIYLPDGTITNETTGPGTLKWTSIGGISPYMSVAVQTTEDGGFFRHHGFSHAAIKSSIIANLKARKFVRGASTITMQLAKNLFLVREKTLSRKFEEMILTDYLEQAFTKDELMELYLNVIEFGPDVYGIGPAARYYFGRDPIELNLAESLFLSSMLPAPLKLSGLRNGGSLSDGWQKTIQHLMSIAKKSGLITQEELDEGLEELVVFHNTGARGPARRYSERQLGTMDPSPDEADGPTVAPSPKRAEIQPHAGP